MQFPPAENFVYSNVVTPPNPALSGTSITVTTGEGTRFPDPATDGEYSITVWPQNTQPLSTNAEIMTVTAKSGDVLTVVRAQEGSAAKTITQEFQLAMTITADRQEFSTQSNWFKVTQNTHGFAVLDAVYHNGTNWVKAQANASTTLATHIVGQVIDANNIILVNQGRIVIASHGKTPGSLYYLSSGTPGANTLTLPTLFQQPLFTVESTSIIQVGIIRSEIGTIQASDISYTPSWLSSGVAPAIGDGTITGKYTKIGKKIWGRVDIVFGATTTFGTGTYRVTFPSTSVLPSDRVVGNALFLDAGVAYYVGIARTIGSTACGVTVPASATWTPTAPFTQAAGDVVSIMFTYEEA